MVSAGSITLAGFVESVFGFAFISFRLLNIGSPPDLPSSESTSCLSFNGALGSIEIGCCVYALASAGLMGLSNDLLRSIKGSSRKWKSLKYICSLLGSTV